MLSSMGLQRIEPDGVAEQHGDKEPGHVRSGPDMGHPEKPAGHEGV